MKTAGLSFSLPIGATVWTRVMVLTGNSAEAVVPPGALYAGCFSAAVAFP